MTNPRTQDTRYKLKPCAKCGTPDWMYGHRKFCSSCLYAKKQTPQEIQKRRAQRAFLDNVRRGKIIRQPCVACDPNFARPGTIHGHHEDYSRPLEVIWLCPLHHKWVHQYGLAYVLKNKDAA